MELEDNFQNGIGMQILEQTIINKEAKAKQFFIKKRKETNQELEKKTENLLALLSTPKKNTSFYGTTDLNMLNKFDLTSEKLVPELVKIGELVLTSLTNSSRVPLLLPINEINAICIEKQNNTPSELLQTLALRFMMALRPSLQKHYFIDADFGRGFSKLSAIDKGKISISLCTKSREIQATFNELSDIVVNANQNFLSNFPSIEAYNRKAGLMLQPYHFVFINNFPLGFNSDDTEKLLNLIRNKNATRAGIFIFMVIDSNGDIPYGVELDKIRNSCLYLSKNRQGSYGFNDLKLNLSGINYVIHPDFTLPTNLKKIVHAINNQETKEDILTFEKQIDTLITTDEIWKEQAIKGFKTPIGYLNEKDLHYFEFGFSTTDYFALIGGLPGYGKTILLHNIILNGALFFSPLEIHYYLIDCKNGTSFKPYEKLPHTKILAISNERDYAKSILEHLIEEECTNRAQLFKDSGAADFEDYRSKTKKILPRIVVVIDEFQVLLEQPDRMSSQIEGLLEKTIQLGRSFGFNLILCTQGLGRVTFNPDNVSRRYAFNLTTRESEKIIRNEGATRLTRKGSAIMNNTQHGDLAQNVNFQAAYLDDKNKLPIYIQQLAAKAKVKFPDNPFSKFISDGSTEGDVKRNRTLFNHINKDSFPVNDNFCDIFLGEPCFVRKQHSYITIRRQSKSNLLIVGGDKKVGINLIAHSLFQLHKQSSSESKFFVFDFFNINSPFKGKFNFLADNSDQFQIISELQTENAITQITEEMSSRFSAAQKGITTTGRIILCFLGIQNAEILKEQEGSFGSTKPEITKQLFKLFNQGPNLGIHSIIYSLSHSGLSEVFDFNTAKNFENKVALFGGDAIKILKDDSRSIRDKGLALLEAPEGITTNEVDLFKIYGALEHSDDTSVKNKNSSLLSEITF